MRRTAALCATPLSNLRLQVVGQFDAITSQVLHPLLQILTSVAESAGFHESTTNFLCLLVDKKRINVLKAITTAFDALYCEATDTQVGTAAITLGRTLI